MRNLLWVVQCRRQAASGKQPARWRIYRFNLQANGTPAVTNRRSTARLIAAVAPGCCPGYEFRTRRYADTGKA